jgi:hypothetical protein
MDEWKQGSFQFPGMYKKTKWMFTCLCWHCLRIFEVPAGIFLQGDPTCVCGSENISANWEARAMMEELQHLDKGPITHHNFGRKIKTWSKEKGATFEP